MTSWATEKWGISSAKSLVVDDKPGVRLLIYIKKNKGPNNLQTLRNKKQLKPLPKMNNDHLKLPTDICCSKNFQ